MTRRIAVRLLPLTFAVVLLAGCAPARTIPEPVSADLQASVVQVAELAKSTDYPAALAALDALEARLAEESAAGTVTAEDAATITASIGLVRGDLQALLAPTPAPVETQPAPEPTESTSEAPVDPTPTPEPDTDEDNGGGGGSGGDDGSGDSGGDSGGDAENEDTSGNSGG